MSPRLAHYDLADIRIRHALGRTTRDDVEALLGELDDTRDSLRDLAADFKLSPGAEAATLAFEIRDRLGEAEDAAKEYEKLAREHEAFEHGVGAVLQAMRESEAAQELMSEPKPFATADELCSMCSAGHADEFDLCPHGKKVRELCVQTTGPTQTGLVNLVVYVVPLVQLLRRVASTFRPNNNTRVSAKRLRNAR